MLKNFISAKFTLSSFDIERQIKSLKMVENIKEKPWQK